MGKQPKAVPEVKAKPPPRPEVKPEPPKKLSCMVTPDKPDKPGLLLVSTTKTQDGCYVLAWQQQSTTWLVSEGQQWYIFANKVLKADLAFTSVFALSVLILLFINRAR